MLSNTISHVNSNPLTNVNAVTTPFVNLFERLPSLSFKLLKLFYEEWAMAINRSDRSLKELGLRFKRHPDRISEALSYLTKKGFLAKYSGGSRNAFRGITCEGVYYLENQTTDQTAKQIPIIPYIDLMNKDLDLIKILEEAPICGQVEEKDPNDLLEDFFIGQRTPYQSRHEIKMAINRSKIGPIRRSRLIQRLISNKKDRPIKSLRSYFLKCLQNEESEIANLNKVFKGKNVPFHLYAEC